MFTIKSYFNDNIRKFRKLETAVKAFKKLNAFNPFGCSGSNYYLEDNSGNMLDVDCNCNSAIVRIKGTKQIVGEFEF